MNRKSLSWVAVVVAVFLFGWFVWPGQDNDGGNNNNGSSQNQNGRTSTPLPGGGSNDDFGPDLSQNDDGTVSLFGTLTASDDEARGNLKLLSGSSVVYLRTGRDFSSLIGKEVVVNISGTLDSFTLLNITGVSL